jgi:RsiW-degrading membrane proteinase PrsW (M82 family)
MERGDQESEDSQPIKDNSDVMQLVALIAIVVLPAIAALFVFKTISIPVSDIVLFVIFVCVFLSGFWIGWDEHENHRELWKNLRERLFGNERREQKTIMTHRIMDRENQTPEEDFQSIKGNSDLILLIALLAFIMIVGVAVLLIIFDTRHLYPPRTFPFLCGVSTLRGKLF